MYDEMDLFQGPFCNVLTAISLLLIMHQKKQFNFHSGFDLHNLNQKELQDIFFNSNSSIDGDITLKLSMNIPGYIQDAQQDYINLLLRDDIDEIFIMAPYFSDDRITRALIIASNKIYQKHSSDNYKNNKYKLKLKNFINIYDNNSRKNNLKFIKKVHVIFSKKQENILIEQVSKYHSYYLRNNPIVETRQFSYSKGEDIFDILHAKQMVVILKDKDKNWTKYVKFGGSHNPAGK